LVDTRRWLSDPTHWDPDEKRAGFSDKGLARIQFASALVAAIEAKQINETDSLAAAANLVAEGQRKDGSWRVDAEGATGSPATYGSFLATYQARRVLEKADAQRYRDAVARADQWFRKTEAKTVLDAAATLLALKGREGADVITKCRACLDVIAKGESSTGGWGPYVNSPPESFDTAMVVLALCQHTAKPKVTEMAKRGRSYLLATQQTDGSWPETTRPAGNESYAQRLSTTAWATLALLESRPVASAR
jgi:hypothetical protein